MYLEYRGPKSKKTLFQGSRAYEFVPDPDFDGRMIARNRQNQRNIPDEDAQAILKMQAMTSAPCIFKVSDGEALLADTEFRATVLGSPQVILAMLRNAGVDIDALGAAMPEIPLDEMSYQSLKKFAAGRGWSDIVSLKKPELLAGIKERMNDTPGDADGDT